MKHRLGVLAVLLVVGGGLVVPVGSLTAQGTNAPDVNLQPHAMGTWKLNAAKSRYSPGPAPRDNVRTYEYLGRGVEFTLNETVAADGTRTAARLVYRYDGREYPTGAPGNTTSYRNIDPYTMEYTQKVNGKVTVVLTRTVSKDGRTLTHHGKGTNAQGQQVDNIIVLEKQ